MELITIKPTVELYKQLNTAYQHFNNRLFKDELPPCLITVQRDKNTQGYFSPLRWSNIKGYKTHEISLNPAYFANRQLIEIFQTLVHEQCHLWQHEYGSPSRSGYHNQEWSNKMASIGLMPSATGKVGGAKVGQRIADYPIIGGNFEMACVELVKSGYMLYWVDRRVAKNYIASENIKTNGTSQKLSAHEYLTCKFDEVTNDFDAQQVSEVQRKIKLKVKYHCEGCGANVWGKSSLVIRCENCQIMFSAVQIDDTLRFSSIKSFKNPTIQHHL